MIRILIADDHGIVRAGLRLVLDRLALLEVVAEAADGREAVRLAKETKPDIVILDVGMPLLNGLDAASQIIAEQPSVGVIFLSMHADESYILRAVECGARGYLLKDNADEDLEPAIRAVVSGKRYFSPAIAQTLSEDYFGALRKRGARDSYELLTEREAEVLQLLAEGKSNKEVAGVLQLSPYTVESHRANLMQKLNLHNTAEIVLYAVRKGVIKP